MLFTESRDQYYRLLIA